MLHARERNSQTRNISEASFNIQQILFCSLLCPMPSIYSSSIDLSSIYLPINHLSSNIHLSSIYLPIYGCIYQSINHLHQSISYQSSIYLCIYLAIHLSIYLIYLSIYLIQIISLWSDWLQTLIILLKSPKCWDSQHGSMTSTIHQIKKMRQQ